LGRERKGCDSNHHASALGSTVDTEGNVSEKSLSPNGRYVNAIVNDNNVVALYLLVRIKKR